MVVVTLSHLSVDAKLGVEGFDAVVQHGVLFGVVRVEIKPDRCRRHTGTRVNEWITRASEQASKWEGEWSSERAKQANTSRVYDVVVISPVRPHFVASGASLPAMEPKHAAL